MGGSSRGKMGVGGRNGTATATSCVSGMFQSSRTRCDIPMGRSSLFFGPCAAIVERRDRSIEVSRSGLPLGGVCRISRDNSKGGMGWARVVGGHGHRLLSTQTLELHAGHARRKCYELEECRASRERLERVRNNGPLCVEANGSIKTLERLWSNQSGEVGSYLVISNNGR